MVTEVVLQPYSPNQSYSDSVFESTDLFSGVVQDNGNAPITFIIFINDQIATLEQHGVKAKPFADNLKLYLRVTGISDMYFTYYLHQVFVFVCLSVCLSVCAQRPVMGVK